MTNVPPATPPQATGAITSSPTSQDSLSQQQQHAGQRSGGGHTPKEAPPPSSPAVTIAASLAGLREGMRFKGTAIGSDANGLPVLRTPNGTFVLSQALEQLALKGEVEIEIRVAGNKITALILSINGKAQHPPKEVGLTMTSVTAEGTSSKTLAGGLAAGPAPRGSLPSTFNIGSQLTATVVGTSATPAPGMKLEAGSTLILKISNVDLALPKSTSAGVATTTASPGAGTAQTALGTQATPAGLANEIKSQLATNLSTTSSNTGVLGGNAGRLAGAATVPPAATLSTAPAPASASATTAPSPSSAGPMGTNSAVIAGATTTAQPATSSATAAAPSPALSAAISQSALLSQQDTSAPASTSTTAQLQARLIQGEVIGSHRDGGLLVRTPFGDISLMTRAVLPQGSQLTFEAVATRAPDSMQRPIPQGQSAPMEGGVIPPQTMAAVKAFASEWPALKEIIATLQSTNPEAARNLLTSIMPGANSSLASSILLFIAALRGGDMKGWLGNDATILLERAGRDDLLNRLNSDAAQLGRAAETSAQGDWRAIPFPLYDGSDLQQLWAFVREHRRSGDLADKKALRFVVELDLTALGGMQLDGLIQDKQFDLIVRSSGLLPHGVRQDLSGLFEGSVEATGFSGSIIFQADTTWPVSPFREAQQEAGGHGEIVA